MDSLRIERIIQMQIDLEYTQKHLEWVKRAFYLSTQVPNAPKRGAKRGYVYECDLGVGIGSEMQKKRPCIVISNDNANLSSPNVIVIPITHDTAALRCMVPIQTYKDGNGNIILDGSANTSCITTVSKARLGNLIVKLSNIDLEAVEDSLDISLGTIRRTNKLKAEIDRLKKYIGTLLNKKDT